MEQERELLKKQQEKFFEREKELETRISNADRIAGEIKKRHPKAKISDSQRSEGTEYSEDGDVHMKDWYVPRYEEKVPIFNNKGIDLEGFEEKCLRHFLYPFNYQKDEKAKASFVEDHLGGDVLRWYWIKERRVQRNYPDVDLLFIHLRAKFPPESPIEISRSRLNKTGMRKVL